MCQFVETIRLEDGVLHRLQLHNERMNRTRLEMFGCTNRLAIEDYLTADTSTRTGIYKCRVVYGITVEEVSTEAYTMRPIKSLQLVYDNEIDYRYKSTNRKHIEQLFSQRNSCDDVVIVKNGYITDSSYCNLVFFDGSRWVTPNTPLLKGVERERLLINGAITELPIRVEDIHNYTHVRLVNAMMPFSIAQQVEICNIHQ